MLAVYLGLLALGVILFVLSGIAPFRVAALLRQRYPQHWQTIVDAAQGKLGGVRTWANMQYVLRSPALPALGDPALNRWRIVWRYGQWIGWLCWAGALAMRMGWI